MTEDKNGTVKTVFSIVFVTLLGKIMGLVRDMIFAGLYGTGSIEANAFLTASRIPRLFFDAIFASAISSSFIPIFNEYLKDKQKKKATDFANNFISIVFIITLTLTAIGMVLAFPLVKGFADGFDSDTTKLCTELLIILFPMIICTGLAYAFTGILQSFGEFLVPASMSIVSNGIIIAYFAFLSDKFGVFGLALAFLVGWLMQAVIQIPMLLKKGYKYRVKIVFKDEGIKKVGALMLPVMVSTWVQPINIAINTKFASHLSDGIAALDYANNLYLIITGVLVLSVANVVFPDLSRLTGEESKEEFGEKIRTTLKGIFFLLIPMMLGVMMLAEPIVRIIYQRGEFTSYSTKITADALKFFSIGMLGYGMQNILCRGFYAKQDGKTPLITGLISIISNIILSFLLFNAMQINGLALASALSAIISAITLFVPMKKEMKNIMDKEGYINILKMGISGLVMAVVVKLTYSLFTVGDLKNTIIAVGVSVIVGVLSYMILSMILKVEQAKIFFKMFKK